MLALLSTVQALPAGDERIAVERASVPLARNAALVQQAAVDEVVARRIAVDHGGSLEREDTTLRLHLPPA
jgi:hypothetical protein